MDYHKPVLVHEVLDALEPKPGQVLVDGTFGHGGHALELARRIGKEGILAGLDLDPEMLEIGRERIEAAMGGEDAPRFVFAATSYEHVGDVLREACIDKGADGILLDLGVNSLQLDDPERGFSFQQDAPLDGRYNPREGAKTMADILNTASERELADIFHGYGDERHARKIARRVVSERKDEPFARSQRFAGLVSSIYPPRDRYGRIHPATRCMMALRIAVNDELGAVERGIHACLDNLALGGRLAVISFHSGEDRIVKRIFREKSAPRPDPNNLYSATTMEGVAYRQSSAKAIKCSKEEAEANPRARSAKLRVIEFTGERGAEP